MDQELKSMLSLLLGKVDVLNDKFDGLNGRVDGLSDRVDGLSDRVDGLTLMSSGIKEILPTLPPRMMSPGSKPKLTASKGYCQPWRPRVI